MNQESINKLLSSGEFSSVAEIVAEPERAVEVLEALEADGKGTRKRSKKVTFLLLPDGETVVQLPAAIKASPKSKALKMAIMAFLVAHNEENGTDYEAKDVRFATLSDWSELSLG